MENHKAMTDFDFLVLRARSSAKRILRMLGTCGGIAKPEFYPSTAAYKLIDFLASRMILE